MTQLYEKQQSTVKVLKIIVFCVGVHSVALGTVIYFFTSSFYQFFLGEPIANPFFVRQSGIFLFLIGLFYLFPLTNINRYHQFIILSIVSKVFAVAFLLSNAHLTPFPPMIYLTAVIDGLMAIALATPYFFYLRRDVLGQRQQMATAAGAPHE
ncbi:MAG: hypothetical protein P8X86_19120 [Desulfofustis sp.]|jgi:hypothetical protein